MNALYRVGTFTIKGNILTLCMIFCLMVTSCFLVCVHIHYEKWLLNIPE
jgi:hypothetical protein